jgi:hypothetical protein
MFETTQDWEEVLDENERREFLWNVLGRYDHYISTANTKAAFVITLGSFVIGGMVLKLVSQKGVSGFIVALSVIAVGLILLAILQAIVSISPNVTSSSSDDSKIFFGDVAAHETGGGYEKRIKQMTDAESLADLAQQVFEVSQVVKAKFQDLQLAFWLLFGGVMVGSLIAMVELTG